MIMQRDQEYKVQILKWSFAFLSLIGIIAAAYLAGDGWSGWLVTGWLTVAYLACLGLGWSICNFSESEKSKSEYGYHQRSGEIWLWLVISVGALALACWRLGELPVRLLPAITLFVAANALLNRSGLIAGLIRGAGAGTLTLLGWGSVRHSLFQILDTPVWFLLSFLVLWLTGSELIQRGLELKAENKENIARLTFDRARIFQMLSIAPLFFLGQMKSMGVIYGIALFFMLVVSESQYRILQSQKAVVDQKQITGTNLLIEILLLAACLFGKLV
jgi:4-hydroxybenzoate polyprenyltransferase